MTSARYRLIEEFNRNALKKKVEEDRIKNLKKARDIGNNYSSSFSRGDSRSK
jgi:hypothetical protein